MTPPLISFLAFLFFFQLGDLPLLDPDEARHAEIAREMIVESNWLTPSLGGEPYGEKPAGFYWLVALAFTTFGIGEWTARLPSAAAAFAGVLLVHRDVRRTAGRNAALAAPLVLSTSILYLGAARLVLVDMVFSTLVTASLLSFRRWIGMPARGFPIAAYTLAAAAVLVKGPVALVLIGGTLAAYRAVTADRTLVRDLRFPAAALVFSVLVLPWYVSAALQGDSIEHFLWMGNVLRFLGVGRAGDPEPFLYYAYVLPLAALPWPLLWPAIITERKPLDPFLVAWAAVTVGFFTLSSSKLPTYVLPALPAISMLFAERMPESPAWPPRAFARARVAAAVWAALLVALPLAIALAVPPRDVPWKAALPWTALAAIPALAAIRARSPLGTTLAFAGSIVVLGIVFLRVGAPHLARYRSTESAGRVLAASLPAEGRLVSYHFRSNALRFYSGRRVERAASLEEVARRLSAEPPVAAALRTWDRHALDGLLDRPAYVWWLEWASHRMIVSNLPPAGTEPVAILGPGTHATDKTNEPTGRRSPKNSRAQDGPQRFGPG